ncbi:TetR/AcrR family transcriptional regulator C-terminal domain-containing protein [Streptomyces coffeae]|uniref:TetR/AcrR family transcriptional regulator C-terminal domain-containing protein n=1 Tax=Streptomyces coffeae TaxID=621382 RepID=A0ABS1NF80_9ACTN|nr:TetR/AcrR family transcriptional regulator C-terminal domain-containing protein [Streptomyces coffeae]MBL1098733.1 TetR/AcrR family transcriptional regulator C-terminal domain-containing protein [Streptomyces coffeae]
MGLDRTAVVTAALELLDETGLDKLTMRKVAERLGVQLNTVYWHASSKPRLLELMADVMLHGCADDPLPEPWEERARTLADRYRAALLARRDGARVVAGTDVAEDNTLRFADALTGAFLAGGHSPAEAAWRTWALVYFTLGLVQEEQAAGRTGSPERLRSAATAERYPALAAAVPHFGDFEDRFGHGADLIVSGRTR